MRLPWATTLASCPVPPRPSLAICTRPYEPNSKRPVSPGIAGRAMGDVGTAMGVEGPISTPAGAVADGVAEGGGEGAGAWAEAGGGGAGASWANDGRVTDRTNAVMTADGRTRWRIDSRFRAEIGDVVDRGAARVRAPRGPWCHRFVVRR